MQSVISTSLPEHSTGAVINRIPRVTNASTRAIAPGIEFGGGGGDTSQYREYVIISMLKYIFAWTLAQDIHVPGKQNS